MAICIVDPSVCMEESASQSVQRETARLEQSKCIFSEKERKGAGYLSALSLALTLHPFSVATLCIFRLGVCVKRASYLPLLQQLLLPKAGLCLKKRKVGVGFPASCCTTEITKSVWTVSTGTRAEQLGENCGEYFILAVVPFWAAIPVSQILRPRLSQKAAKPKANCSTAPSSLCHERDPVLGRLGCLLLLHDHHHHHRLYPPSYDTWIPYLHCTYAEARSTDTVRIPQRLRRRPDSPYTSPFEQRAANLRNPTNLDARRRRHLYRRSLCILYLVLELNLPTPERFCLER